jgi:hypothetical protein
MRNITLARYLFTQFLVVNLQSYKIAFMNLKSILI